MVSSPVLRPKLRERRHSITCSTHATPSDDAAAEQAASFIDEMVRETFEGLFVSSSARYLLEESGDRNPKDRNELKEILSGVVSPRLEAMPAAVIPMIDAYLLALTSDEGATTNDDIVKVLIVLKEFIIQEVEAKMPESVRLLQQAVDAVDREARAQVYSAASSLSTVELLESSSRLLDQLEADPQLDKRLLLKLVVIRHELRAKLKESEKAAWNRFAQLGQVPAEDLDRIEKLISETVESQKKAVEDICLAECGQPGRLADCIAALMAESVDVGAQSLVELERTLIDACERLSSSMKTTETSLMDDGYRP
jgi:hypothetical protein